MNSIEQSFSPYIENDPPGLPAIPLTKGDKEGVDLVCIVPLNKGDTA